MRDGSYTRSVTGNGFGRVQAWEGTCGMRAAIAGNYGITKP
jgi:hypothetical protein